ncbi:ABC transporter permease [Limibaculum sp. M0105]|uniref:Transport permease protein n=1 Tax=Thermohalobaculum xanthum TaxID=2753746 RepID=A0A8J7SD01_9RHOB|nr:ABC transporter permease [Thermohalobaculum xanthum]MBK0399752.1 ABC transporter permease [Thermohalobaculum xanthum]
MKEKTLILEPGRADKEYWRDLWRYRELFFVLAWRDISARYKQTVVGVLWAVLQPVLTMIVMTLVFSKLAGLPSEGAAPYAIMVYAAMLPWQFFANSLSASGNSLVGNARLISKIYFPRLVIPTASVITAFIDFLIAFVILLALMGIYNFWPSWRLLTLPVFTCIAFLAAIGPGLLLASLNVKYRDFRYVIPFIVQFGLYISPVGFSTSIVREKLGEALFMIYALNPMVGVIDGFRWAILGAEATVYWPGLAISLAAISLFLWLGITRFRRTEKTFADVI